MALHRRHLGGRGHVLDDRVEHRLHALVLERRAAGHQADLVLDRAGAQAALDLRVLEQSALEVLVEQRLVALGGRLDHLGAPLLAVLAHLGRNVAVLEFHALGLVVPEYGLHLDQVDDAGEGFLGPDGELDRHGISAQARPDLIHATQEVGAGAVHLVDEGHPRHAVLVHLPPDRLRLRLHAGHGAVHGHGGIEHAQAPLDLDGEIDVPGSVDDVDAVLGEALVHPLPETGGGGGRDRDAALLLLFHVVHDGRAVVHFADLVRHARIEQDALRRGGLTRVDVRRDTDVPVSFDGRGTWHSLCAARNL